MTDEEFEKRLLELLWNPPQKTYPSSSGGLYFYEDIDFPKWLEQILALFKKAGWISPPECKQCNQRQLGSERMLNREAALDERQLRGEISEWKGRYYKADESRTEGER